MDRTADLALTLAGGPESVRLARRSVRSLLDGFAPPDLIEDARLVVSELAANAVRHGGPTYTVRAWVFPIARVLRLEVHDAGRTTSSPVADPAADDAEQGRGLQIVASLAADMGHELDVDGTLLWAELRWAPW